MKNERSENVAAGTRTKTGNAATNTILPPRGVIVIILAPADTAQAGTRMTKSPDTGIHAPRGLIGMTRKGGQGLSVRGPRFRILIRVQTQIRRGQIRMLLIDVVIVRADQVDTVDVNLKSVIEAVAIAHVPQDPIPTATLITLAEMPTRKTLQIHAANRFPTTQTPKSVPPSPPLPLTANPSTPVHTVEHFFPVKEQPWHPMCKTANEFHVEEKSV